MPLTECAAIYMRFGDFGLDLCSITIFEMHTAPGVCCMLLEQYVFQIWFWWISNLEYSSRSLIINGPGP